MNEQIRELAKQADGVFIHKLFTGAKQYTFLEKDLEKFVELIVKECMACSTWVGRANNTAIEPVHTAHAINQRIRKHFGVEE